MRDLFLVVAYKTTAHHSFHECTRVRSMTLEEMAASVLRFCQRPTSTGVRLAIAQRVLSMSQLLWRPPVWSSLDYRHYYTWNTSCHLSYHQTKL